MRTLKCLALSGFVLCLTTAQGWASVSGCTYDGVTLKGKVKVVESFADFKVKEVTSFPDLKVQKVTSFADDCGRWHFVESFPDFTIEYVSSFEDFSIEFVDSFPGQP